MFMRPYSTKSIANISWYMESANEQQDTHLTAICVRNNKEFLKVTYKTFKYSAYGILNRP